MKITYPRPPDIKGRVYIYPQRNGFCLWCGKDLSFDLRRKSFCCNDHSELYEQNFVWHVQKETIFERDNYTCVKCGLSAKQYYSLDYIIRRNYCSKHNLLIYNYILECDHIRPVKMGGNPFDHDNLQTICQKCHKEKTKKDMEQMNQMLMICKAIRNYWIKKRREKILLSYFD